MEEEHKQTTTTTLFDGYTFMVLPYNGKESNVDGKKEEDNRIHKNKIKLVKQCFFFICFFAPCYVEAGKSFSEWCWG